MKGCNLKELKCRLDIRKKLFDERVVKNWHRLLREHVDTPLLETFKACWDPMQPDGVGGSPDYAKGLELDDLQSQCKPFYHSMIQYDWRSLSVEGENRIAASNWLDQIRIYLLNTNYNHSSVLSDSTKHEDKV